jgi:hypothetical protein
MQHLLSIKPYLPEPVVYYVIAKYAAIEDFIRWNDIKSFKLHWDGISSIQLWKYVAKYKKKKIAKRLLKKEKSYPSNAWKAVLSLDGIGFAEWLYGKVGFSMDVPIHISVSDHCPKMIEWLFNKTIEHFKLSRISRYPIIVDDWDDRPNFEYEDYGEYKVPTKTNCLSRNKWYHFARNFKEIKDCQERKRKRMSINFDKQEDVLDSEDEEFILEQSRGIDAMFNTIDTQNYLHDEIFAMDDD